MKQVIKSILIIFASMWMGETIKSWIPAPIPTMIYAMVVLFLLLIFKVVKLEDIDNLATKLLSILAFFFVPAAVGLMESYKMIETELLKVVATLLISFVLTVLAVAFTVHFVRKRLSRVNSNQNEERSKSHAA